MKPKVLPYLLFASSALWIILTCSAPNLGSNDQALFGAAIVLPVLLGISIAGYPWSRNPPEPVPLPRRILQGLLLTAAFLWLILSSPVLFLFLYIAFGTGWE